jgi:large subunit ribosomal protein L13e
MTKHNNVIPNVHLRKHWQRRRLIHTHFDQPANKLKRLNLRKAKADRMAPRPIENLRPVVSSATRKYAGKVRYGRGFTLQELRQAKLSARFAKTVGISVDHRRTNTSEHQLQMNVDRLNSYKDKLILFPRREGKPKKGQINDSTQAQLTSAAAADQTKGNLPIARPSTEPVFAAITQKGKDAQCYRNLRTARTHKHYFGRREERAKKEAEKNK